MCVATLAHLDRSARQTKRERETGVVRAVAPIRTTDKRRAAVVCGDFPLDLLCVAEYSNREV